MFDLATPQIGLDYAGSTSGSYPGLDQFDRVVDQAWTGFGTNTSAGTLDENKYGFDAAGDVAFKQNAALDAYNATNSPASPTELDQVYTNDYLGQLTSLAQGKINVDESGTVIVNSLGAASLVSGTQDFSQSWTVDGIGNWTAFSQSGTGATTVDQTRSPTANNEIGSITSATGTPDWASPAYDNAGNMTAMPQPGNETVALGVIYNGWNQPVNFASGTVINVSLSYDGLGRMVTRVNNLAAADVVATTDYYYAGKQMLESVEQPPASPDSTSSYSTTQYVWSARDPNAPIEQDRVSFTYFSGSGWNSGVTNRFYYLADANSNVTALTDSTGAVLERYAYNAYGQYTIYNSTWSATYSSSEYGNTIFFAGMRQDQTTGIYYTDARSYNFSTGTFDTPDPINADPDTYRYAGNDPIGSSDPSGLIDTTGGTSTTPEPAPCFETIGSLAASGANANTQSGTVTFSSAGVPSIVPNGAAQAPTIVVNLPPTFAVVTLPQTAGEDVPTDNLPQIYATPTYDHYVSTMTPATARDIQARVGFGTPGSQYISPDMIAAADVVATGDYSPAYGAAYNFLRVRGYQEGVGPITLFSESVEALAAGQGAVNMVRGAPCGATRFVNGVSVADRRTGRTLSGTVDLEPTLERIENGIPFPHRNDGAVFQNRPLPGNSTPQLPVKPLGYYHEFVQPTPGTNGPGPQRIVVGDGGEMYYTPDHYQSFIPISTK